LLLPRAASGLEMFEVREAGDRGLQLAGIEGGGLEGIADGAVVGGEEFVPFVDFAEEGGEGGEEGGRDACRGWGGGNRGSSARGAGTK
jgi:hypothetical protein